jgi:hypothetical protein
MQWNSFLNCRSHYYLVSRGVSVEVQILDKFYNTFRVDNKYNLVFPYFDKKGLCGYEYKSKKFRGFSKGGKKGLWLSRNVLKQSTIIICESVIDCLSYEFLKPNPNYGYIATGGMLSETSKELLISLFKRSSKGCSFVIAVDNDKGGDELAEKIQGLSNKPLSRIKSKNKDWNEELKNVFSNNLIIF